MTTNGTPTALERLLSAMQDDEGFPALSGTISEINQIVSSESESAGKLTKAILQDFALTNKLLRQVNTVSYGQFGGKINTISKAVVILGFETVRNVAMTLILVEFLQNKSQATQLRDEVLSSFFAGLVAMKLSHGRNVRDTEEAMICAMFHNLGKLLVTFYLFKESQEISSLMAEGLSESQSSYKVLGTSYNDLGIAIARNWNFPERLQIGMQKISSEKIRKPRDELEHLNVTVNLANELCMIAASTPTEDKDQRLDQLAARYQDAVKIDAQQLNKALEHGLEEMTVRASILNLPTSSSPLFKTVLHWSGHENLPEDLPQEENGMDGITGLDQVAEQNAESEPARIDPETILGDGIQDVTNTLVTDYSLNDVLHMVLESMFRGMGFNRIVALVRDAKTSTMRARFGFGADIDGLLPRFHFPLKFEPDVFHVALEKGVDIVIEDVRADNIASKIPAWYHESVSAECFLLLPVMIQGNAIGLIYADMRTANSLQVTPRQLSLLRTLRNQAVLAIRQKQ
jgi:HD-like signal output (HDOD) protein